MAPVRPVPPLQCITIGPSPAGMDRSLVKYSATECEYMGTPSLGHPVYCRCSTYGIDESIPRLNITGTNKRIDVDHTFRISSVERVVIQKVL